MQILCTKVLLFFPFRSHEIARGGRRMTPMAIVALCRSRKQRTDERRSPGRKIWTDRHCRGGVSWHLARSTSRLQEPFSFAPRLIKERTHSASPSGMLHMDLGPIRNKVLAAISPLKPAGSESATPANFLFDTKRMHVPWRLRMT